MSVRSEVITQFKQVAKEQDKRLAPLADDLPLLDSGLDSLCFAIIVARLEDALGIDPFSDCRRCSLSRDRGRLHQVLRKCRKVDRASLWNALSAAGNLSGRFLCGADATVALGDLVRGSALGGRGEELRGRSVLVATTDQLTAALALIELDGIARRLVLCPPDLPPEHLPFVIDSAAVDAIVSDRTDAWTGHCPALDVSSRAVRRSCPPTTIGACRHQTEWILLTSGTTGLPKLVVHTLASLAGAIAAGSAPASPVVWSTFYDIRRYGGLQIFLRAVLTGASLVLSSAQESTADFLIRAGAHGVTHISGTPSHWRRALMSPSAHMIAPQYVRLSGEIADQAILNHLQSFYPQARIAHAFASTEAGVAFDVNDGLAGFPASLIGSRAPMSR